jgi:hypothetical protein
MAVTGVKTGPLDVFESDSSRWPEPPNYDKRIRNLSDRVADLELAIEKLQAKNADEQRSKVRLFKWGGWK